MTPRLRQVEAPPARLLLRQGRGPKLRAYPAGDRVWASLFRLKTEASSLGWRLSPPSSPPISNA